MKNVLITDYVHQLLIDGLKEQGFVVNYAPKMNHEEVMKVIDQYFGIIVNSKINVHKTMIDKACNLSFIGRLGSGMEIIDTAYAESNNIKVYNSPEGNRNAVAEHALGMLLSMLNNLSRADRQVRNFVWEREKNRGIELSGMKVGIIGFGHTGRKFAEKLVGFEVEIMAHDKYKEHFADDIRYVKEVLKSDIQKACDVISFHLPLTHETHHYVDAEFIKQCKKGVYLINTSRGAICKTAELIEGLESGQVAGACLDVFENEKQTDMDEDEKSMYKELYDKDNVVLSPHIAGWTQESKYKLANVLLQKIIHGMER